MTVDIEPSFRSEKAVGWLLDGWSEQRERFAELGVRPSVHDALTSVDLLDHALRPMFTPIRPAQVTHAVTNGLAALVGLAAKWTDGTPFVLTEHGVYLRERYLGYRVSPYTWPVKAFMLGFLRQLCTAAYRSADLVTPGNRYNQRWETRFGAAPDRLRTVYNGVDPEHFPQAGAEPDVPTISWAGRIDPIKDLETLIRSFARMRDTMPTLRLRMFGGVASGAQDYLTLCKTLIGELGLEGAAVFEGRVENIQDAYTAGHVVVLSSISEGFPYTLIEAMTSGRATVSTDVGGVTEAVGNTGLIVPPRDPDSMAKACLTLLADDALRHRLGAQARTRALEYFTVEQAVGTFRQIYADLSTGVAVNTTPGVNLPTVPLRLVSGTAA
jgi:glycosyltransferase involved in cell wall biosynthesis